MQLQKTRQGEWYRRNKERVLEANRQRRLELVKFVRDLKDKPCLDCGGKFPSVCMDFHHVRGEKKYEINRMTRTTMSKETVLKEITKCDLLCANCHRLRHAS